jgi:hypothetical protein
MRSTASRLVQCIAAAALCSCCHASAQSHLASVQRRKVPLHSLHLLRGGFADANNANRYSTADRKSLLADVEPGRSLKGGSWLSRLLKRQVQSTSLTVAAAPRYASKPT